ncbi:radical SAM protein [Thiovibrio frasassiensis]|uniref:Radical SAM protein n=1 Tax=Thiovibrio frasassiensis TaxID=2984131 RepID=A0A9X4MI57_9BACT|nr:radical SAM protein [Thiovibrio frasassiensis]MDG4476793.1 radical SAM protein [Thiovibrio frasassiensis]
MHYEGAHIIRPPSEADSIILQVTVGCSHNRCTFCGTYKEERFRIKDQAVVEADLDFAAQYCLKQSRVFLADGDVLSLSQRPLVELLSKIKQRLPWVNRVSLYGNAKAIRNKSVEQLLELKGLGLHRVYMGLESGYDPVLLAIDKGADAVAMIEAGQRVKAANLFLSVTALLGIAGSALSLEHAKATGQVLSGMEPNQIGILTLMLLENTKLYRLEQAGEFKLPTQQGMLSELRTMVEHLDLKKGQLQSNHASNYLAINARMPRDKEAVLAAIDQALAGKTRLKPEYLRAL